MKYSLIYPKLKIQTTQVCVMTTRLSENEQCLMCFYMPMKKTCLVCYIYNTWLDCCRVSFDPSPTEENIRGKTVDFLTTLERAIFTGFLLLLIIFTGFSSLPR